MQINSDPNATPVGRMVDSRTASIIIPAYNGSARIGACLESLLRQSEGRDVEILVIDDGSTDRTADAVQRYGVVRLISQANAGPAAARNRGAGEARGEILLFTDDDCIPAPGWLDAMLAPFSSNEVVGVKGIYSTRQSQIAARFVQIEYEDKYRIMAALPSIDFIDTYSAAFRRDKFLEMAGYDTSFPVACAEDVELSFRMSARGWKMIFAPAAVVSHTHPSTLTSYLKKKYKFAFWRVLAVRKNPSKGVKDSHTPQLMKLQLLFLPALVVSLGIDVTMHPPVSIALLVVILFGLSTLPFALRALRKDPLIALLSPFLLAARACAQFLGVSAGMIHALQRAESSK